MDPVVPYPIHILQIVSLSLIRLGWLFKHIWVHFRRWTVWLSIFNHISGFQNLILLHTPIRLTPAFKSVIMPGTLFIGCHFRFYRCGAFAYSWCDLTHGIISTPSPPLFNTMKISAAPSNKYSEVFFLRAWSLKEVKSSSRILPKTVIDISQSFKISFRTKFLWA